MRDMQSLPEGLEKYWVLAQDPVDAAFCQRERSLLKKAGIVLASVRFQGIALQAQSS